jgi:hypothetical protein
LEGLRLRNRALEEERNELASSYSNLLTMHNQMLKLDVNQNQSRLMKESYTVTFDPYSSSLSET